LVEALRRGKIDRPALAAFLADARVEQT